MDEREWLQSEEEEEEEGEWESLTEAGVSGDIQVEVHTHRNCELSL